VGQEENSRFWSEWEILCEKYRLRDLRERVKHGGVTLEFVSLT
jgi:hypothetical protein